MAPARIRLREPIRSRSLDDVIDRCAGATFEEYTMDEQEHQYLDSGPEYEPDALDCLHTIRDRVRELIYAPDGSDQTPDHDTLIWFVKVELLDLLGQHVVTGPIKSDNAAGDDIPF